MTFTARRTLFVLVACSGCDANDDVRAPQIAAMTPASARPGATVTLTGSYFCAQPQPDDLDDVDPLACDHIGTVSFASTPALVSRYEDTTIAVEVPQLDAATVPVVVTVAGRSSNRFDFVVE